MNDESDAFFLQGPRNAASSSTVDILAFNGIIHKIDTVLEPAYFSRTLESVFKINEASQFMNVLEEGVGFDRLQRLLPPSGKFTILAPSDEAMDEYNGPDLRSDATVRDNFVADHIASSVVPIAARPASTFETLSGKTIAAKEGMFNNAKVVKTVLFREGVVHVIDRPLQPATANSREGSAAPAQLLARLLWWSLLVW